NVFQLFQDLKPLNYSHEDEAQDKISRINTSLEKMNPCKQEVHLDLIYQLLEDSKSLVDLKLPKVTQNTCGLPSAASKKKINLKAEHCKHTQFEKMLRKCVASEKNDQKSKEMKVQPTQKVNPVQ
ncbi:hypothetical protein VP01_6095g1, partial [Puccinia sorghi]